MPLASAFRQWRLSTPQYVHGVLGPQAARDESIVSPNARLKDTTRCSTPICLQLRAATSIAAGR